MPTQEATNGARPASASRVIDLDKARAGRAEAQGEPITVVFGGEEFTLPVEMPAEFAFLANDEDIRGAVGVLLGEDASRFFSQNPSVPDIEALVEAVGNLYGVAPGEAPASASS